MENSDTTESENLTKLETVPRHGATSPKNWPLPLSLSSQPEMSGFEKSIPADPSPIHQSRERFTWPSLLPFFGDGRPKRLRKHFGSLIMEAYNGSLIMEAL